jgi:Co/Zn/Cd efflux system component
MMVACWNVERSLTGLIGRAAILAWSWSLVRSAGAVLPDAVPDASLSRHIRKYLEIDGMG